VTRAPRRFTLALAASLVACAAVGPRALAQAAAPSDAAHALLAVRDADPLELARVVHHFGDSAIVALFTEATPLAVRIAAIRAAPWLAEPEDALAALLSPIGSRDGALSEAAARALFAIAAKLGAAAFDRGERDPRRFAPIIGRLQTIEADAAIRTDLRALAASAALQLEAAGVPAPDR
jgi:hypothetical protein